MSIFPQIAAVKPLHNLKAQIPFFIVIIYLKGLASLIMIPAALQQCWHACTSLLNMTEQLKKSWRIIQKQKSITLLYKTAITCSIFELKVQHFDLQEEKSKNQHQKQTVPSFPKACLHSLWCLVARVECVCWYAQTGKSLGSNGKNFTLKAHLFFLWKFLKPSRSVPFSHSAHTGIYAARRLYRSFLLHCICMYTANYLKLADLKPRLKHSIHRKIAL